MTERSLTAIVDEAKSRWDLHDILVIHRVGKLEPTDQIVLVAVTSAHRGEAFAACQFVMDYLKTRAPFWKKERTPQGERWVEARYRDCPADFDAIASSLTKVKGTNLTIIPGLICRAADGTPDVMRGEETQVLGALSQDAARRQVFVLPGTHSKWVVAGARG